MELVLALPPGSIGTLLSRAWYCPSERVLYCAVVASAVDAVSQEQVSAYVKREKEAKQAAEAAAAAASSASSAAGSGTPQQQDAGGAGAGDAKLETKSGLLPLVGRASFHSRCLLGIAETTDSLYLPTSTLQRQIKFPRGALCRALAVCSNTC
jgi:hypothetical protein